MKMRLELATGFGIGSIRIGFLCKIEISKTPKCEQHVVTPAGKGTKVTVAMGKTVDLGPPF